MFIVSSFMFGFDISWFDFQVAIFSFICLNCIERKSLENSRKDAIFSADFLEESFYIVSGEYFVFKLKKNIKIFVCIVHVLIST